MDIIINCGDYEISDEVLGRALLGGALPIRTFHKDQIAQTVGNKSLVEE